MNRTKYNLFWGVSVFVFLHCITFFYIALPGSPLPNLGDSEADGI